MLGRKVSGCYEGLCRSRWSWVSTLSFPGCENLQSRNYTKSQYQQACNFISKHNGSSMHYVLSDSGANFHIFNDRKWFTGFNDLRPTQIQVTTGGGEVQCKWQGTASFESVDNKGKRFVVICPNALLVERCPFCILSQNAMSDKNGQGVASFFNRACMEPVKFKSAA